MKPVKKLVKQLLVFPLIFVAADMLYIFLTGTGLRQEIDSINVGFPFYYMLMSFLYIGEQSYLGDFKTSILYGITRKNYIASQLITIILGTTIGTIGYVLSTIVGQSVTLSTLIKISAYYFSILLIINTLSILISGFGYLYSSKKVPFFVLGIFIVILFVSRDFFAYTMPMAITGFANNYISIFILIGVLASSILFFTSSKIVMSLDIK